MVSKWRCQAWRFQRLAGYVPPELAAGAFLSLGEGLADFAGDPPFAQKMRSSHIHTCIQGVVKFCPSCIQDMSACSCSRMIWHELTKFNARSAFDTLTHLQFLVLLFSQQPCFFKLLRSSLCLMISKTSWGFESMHTHETHQPTHDQAMSLRNSKWKKCKHESTCLLQFNLLLSIFSRCLLLKLLYLLTKRLAIFSRNFFHNYPAEGVQFMVSKSKCQAHFQSLVMCLSNLLLEHFFLLEKDWLTLLEIRLLLKRCEAATFTLASKV